MLNRSLWLFPIGAILITAFSIWLPDILKGYTNAIVPLLGLVMFSMGLTLNFSDFTSVLQRPGIVGLGLCLQYFFMPFVAWLLASVLALPLPVATGLIIIGACPGGTASNVICYLAKGNVALSITLTAVSTIAAVLLTPLLTLVYVDRNIDVPVMEMMKSLLLIIILPVLSGIALNHFFREQLLGFIKLLPAVSIASVILIIGIIVATNEANLYQLSLMLVIAVIMHNLLGLLIGYFLSLVLTRDSQIAKTMALEVGMQNSGLGIVLANQYFSAAVALPGVLFSIWHNISGALLASYWQRRKSEA